MISNLRISDFGLSNTMTTGIISQTGRLLPSQENGGFSILFPTYYNDNYQYVDMIEYYLLHRLLNIEEEMNERIRHYGIKS